MAVPAQEPSCSRQPLSPLRGRLRNHSAALEGPQSPVQGHLPEFWGAQALGRLGLCWGCAGRAQLCLRGRHGAEGAGETDPSTVRLITPGFLGKKPQLPRYFCGVQSLGCSSVHVGHFYGASGAQGKRDRAQKHGEEQNIHRGSSSKLKQTPEYPPAGCLCPGRAAGGHRAAPAGGELRRKRRRNSHPLLSQAFPQKRAADERRQGRRGRAARCCRFLGERGAQPALQGGRQGGIPAQ